MDVRKSGWMTKEGGSWKSWKRRFFVLENQELRYYKAETDHAAKLEPQGVIPMRGCNVLRLDRNERPDKKFGFKIESKIENDRVYYLNTETVAETNAWMTALQESSGVNYEILDAQASSQSAAFASGSRASQHLSNALELHRKTAILSGYLQKRGGFDGKKSFKRRFFYMDAEGIQYFADPKDSKSKGDISLFGARMVDTNDTSLEFHLQASTYDEGRIYIIKAEDEETFRMWVGQIQKNIDFLSNTLRRALNFWTQKSVFTAFLAWRAAMRFKGTESFEAVDGTMMFFANRDFRPVPPYNSIRGVSAFEMKDYDARVRIAVQKYGTEIPLASLGGRHAVQSELQSMLRTAIQQFCSGGDGTLSSPGSGNGNGNTAVAVGSSNSSSNNSGGASLRCRLRNMAPLPEKETEHAMYDAAIWAGCHAVVDSEDDVRAFALLRRSHLPPIGDTCEHYLIEVSKTPRSAGAETCLAILLMVANTFRPSQPVIIAESYAAGLSAPASSSSSSSSSSSDASASQSLSTMQNIVTPGLAAAGWFDWADVVLNCVPPFVAVTSEAVYLVQKMCWTGKAFDLEQYFSQSSSSSSAYGAKGTASGSAAALVRLHFVSSLDGGLLGDKFHLEHIARAYRRCLRSRQKAAIAVADAAVSAATDPTRHHELLLREKDMAALEVALLKVICYLLFGDFQCFDSNSSNNAWMQRLLACFETPSASVSAVTSNSGAQLQSGVDEHFLSRLWDVFFFDDYDQYSRAHPNTLDSVVSNPAGDGQQQQQQQHHHHRHGPDYLMLLARILSVPCHAVVKLSLLLKTGLLSAAGGYDFTSALFQAMGSASRVLQQAIFSSLSRGSPRSDVHPMAGMLHAAAMRVCANLSSGHGPESTGSQAFGEYALSSASIPMAGGGSTSTCNVRTFLVQQYMKQPVILFGSSAHSASAIAAAAAAAGGGGAAAAATAPPSLLLDGLRCAVVFLHNLMGESDEARMIDLSDGGDLGIQLLSRLSELSLATIAGPFLHGAASGSAGVGHGSSSSSGSAVDLSFCGRCAEAIFGLLWRMCRVRTIRRMLVQKKGVFSLCSLFLRSAVGHGGSGGDEDLKRNIVGFLLVLAMEGPDKVFSSKNQDLLTSVVSCMITAVHGDVLLVSLSLFLVLFSGSGNGIGGNVTAKNVKNMLPELPAAVKRALRFKRDLQVVRFARCLEHKIGLNLEAEGDGGGRRIGKKSQKQKSQKKLGDGYGNGNGNETNTNRNSSSNGSRAVGNVI